jgi:predicted RNA binding protein YcfA (HicA-like mRNA interferase family)
LSTYPPHIWDQLRSITADELCKALVRDGWDLDYGQGSIRIYRNSVTRARIDVHYHPGKTYGSKMLKGLLDDTGWTLEDLRRLKLID